MLKTHASRNTDLRWKFWLVGALLHQDVCSYPRASFSCAPPRVCVFAPVLLRCYQDPVDCAHGCLPAQGHQISPHIARGQPGQMAEFKRLWELQFSTQSPENSNQVREKNYLFFFFHMKTNST